MRADRAGPAVIGEKARLHRAILHAVAYADVFDYPLTTAEIWRYVVGVEATQAQIARVVTSRPAWLSHQDGYFCLRGREHVFPVRRYRAPVAEGMWQTAVRYGRIIGRLPFVRMVGVTGALAADNVEPDADIDYLVVTATGRVWLCRAAVIALVKWAARRGVSLCPNYFLSEDALVLRERNLFTAHELTQMVPVAGLALYDRMRAMNEWTSEYLPNARGAARHVPTLMRAGGAVARVAELAMRHSAGDFVERWEMRRKVKKLSAQGDAHGEAGFAPDVCKGHFEGHGHRILNAFATRLSHVREPVSSEAPPRTVY